MAEQSTGRVALMAIRPEFADQILEGVKRVEFRKRALAADVTQVVVYASAPISAIVGAFSVRSQTTKHPSALWASYSEVGGISRAAYAQYFEGCECGTAIEVGQVWRASSPIALGSAGVGRAPQSFQYLLPRVAGELLTGMHQTK